MTPGPTDATPEVGRRKLSRWHLFARLRLRHKLAVSLSIAALLPVLAVSWVSMSVVLQGLEDGLRAETDRQLRVGLSLVLRNVERLGHESVRLASSTDLSLAMTAGTGPIDLVLAREDPHLASSLVQVADSSGVVVTERVIGGVAERFASLRVVDNSPSIRAGLSFERRVTLVRVGDVLVVRAIAPIVDASYMLQGVVVSTVPLDGEFADWVKGALGVDVLIVAGAARAMSTFFDEFGARVEDIQVPVSTGQRVLSGERMIIEDVVLGREYAIGFTAINNLAGDNIGMFGVAVDRGPVVTAKAAALRSLALGAAGAFVFALGLAGLISRRLTRPIARLHEGAAAIARGDLDQRIAVDEGDEIGDLAVAFSQMTRALKQNQARLADRMRELVGLHDASRAVSSVLSVDQVLKKIVDSVARVLDVRLCALWLVEAPPRDRAGGDVHDAGGNSGHVAPQSLLRLGSARVVHDGAGPTHAVGETVEPLRSIAAEVAVARTTLRIDRVTRDARRRGAAEAAGVSGSLLATPLQRKGAVAGVIIIGRSRKVRPFSEADSTLLSTFADQAATAIENARLYERVTAFSEELEEKVRLRTTELQAMNEELGRTLTELRDTQAQLILSERLAGLGLLVAGVAHEINSPSAAIRGCAEAIGTNVERLAECSHQLATMTSAPEARAEFLRFVAEHTPALAAQRRASPAAVRRLQREIAATLTDAGIEAEDARDAARSLAELGASEEVERMVELLLSLSSASSVSPSGDSGDVRVAARYLTEHVYLHRNAQTIENAIHRVQRIVRALKSYTHLDQQAVLSPADVHEGIENTLVLLDHELGGGITVHRNYGDVPPIPVFVDELNQVWTNLIHNAVQALEGKGSITIETDTRDDGIVVRVIDDGPGIEPTVLPRIFEAFFTTKAQGEGTGLGLGIVRGIIDKHGGTVDASSEPGRTVFEVWLPLEPERRGMRTGRFSVIAPPAGTPDHDDVSDGTDSVTV